jgi:ADP-heptose:LPS heptosyltransferase
VAHDLSRRPYITINNGYDSNVVVSHQRATKCYPHFGTVINRLRQIRNDIAFVQVGTHTSEAIPEVDLNLIGRTSLAEVAGLIRGAVLHLDNEGGLVHLARCVGTKSCVVFGPTSSRYFGYPGNINIDPSFCGGCWWVNETWMNHCPRGFDTARCMTQQSPVAVADAVARFLASRLDSRSFLETSESLNH